MLKHIVLAILVLTTIVPFAHAKRPLKGDSTVVFLDIAAIDRVQRAEIFRVNGRASEVYIAYWKNGRHDTEQTVTGVFSLSFPANHPCASVIENAFHSGKALEVWLTTDSIAVSNSSVDIQVRGERIIRSCEIKN